MKRGNADPGSNMARVLEGTIARLLTRPTRKAKVAKAKTVKEKQKGRRRERATRAEVRMADRHQRTTGKARVKAKIKEEKVKTKIKAAGMVSTLRGEDAPARRAEEARQVAKTQEHHVAGDPHQAGKTLHHATHI